MSEQVAPHLPEAVRPQTCLGSREEPLRCLSKGDRLWCVVLRASNLDPLALVLCRITANSDLGKQPASFLAGIDQGQLLDRREAMPTLLNPRL